MQDVVKKGAEDFRNVIDQFFLRPHDETFPFGDGWELAQPNNYPPYNFYQADPNRYVLEMAVAGLRREEIDIQYESDKRRLTIKGGSSQETKGQGAYIHKGIATRQFAKSFMLGDQMEIEESRLEDGLLKIFFYKHEGKDSVQKIDIK